jgi:hypothetical protein
MFGMSPGKLRKELNRHGISHPEAVPNQ